MNKNILVIISGSLLALGVAGGAFYGGMVFQRSRTAQLRNAFLADRGNSDGFPTDGGGNGNFFGGGNGGGRGAVGQIKSIDGDTITLSTPQSEIQVRLTDDTQIEKVVIGERADLQPGEQISVRGERDSAGDVTATSIQIGGNAPNPGP